MASIVVENTANLVEMVRVLVNHRNIRREVVSYTETNLIRYRIKFALAFIAFFIYMYLALGKLILSTSHIYIHKFSMQKMYAKIDTNNNVASLVANFSHEISFGEKGMHSAYLESASYNISTTDIGYPTLSAISTTNATFSFFETVQPVIVSFDANQTGLQKEQLRGFRNMIDEGHVWVNLNANFKWRLKLTRFLEIPYIYKNVYFTCNVQYIASSDNEMKNVICNT